MKLTSTASLGSQRNAARPVATFSSPSWSTTQPSSVRMSCGPSWLCRSTGGSRRQRQRDAERRVGCARQNAGAAAAEAAGAVHAFVVENVEVAVALLRRRPRSARTACRARARCRTSRARRGDRTVPAVDFGVARVVALRACAIRAESCRRWRSCRTTCLAGRAESRRARGRANRESRLAAGRDRRRRCRSARRARTTTSCRRDRCRE